MWSTKRREISILVLETGLELLTLQAIIAPSTLFDNGEFAEYYIVRPRTLNLDAN
jgi:hypothetical protein